MSKYQFKYAQRYAVYKVFKGICQWCGEPLEYKNIHIDHVLPEELLNNPDKLENIIKSYGLDSTFQINDYENWIPSHQNCNQTKSDRAYQGLPILKTLIDKCIENKPRAKKIEKQLNNEPKKAEILVSIENAITNGVLDTDDLQAFILDYNVEDLTNESTTEIERLISLGILNLVDKNKWISYNILNDDEVLVSDGKIAGIVPRKFPPHMSWLCPYCLSFGPWDGNRCLSCGHFSSPD